MSANTGVAPTRTTAFAVDTKVNDGRMTSSPGPSSRSIAAISSPAVHDGVIKTFWMPNWLSRISLQRRVNPPSPPRFWSQTALAI